MDEKKAVKYLFAIINGERKHISEVESRDIGQQEGQHLKITVADPPPR